MTIDMRRFYDDPDEHRKWGVEIVSQGLFPTEAHLIERWFKPGASVLNIGCGGGREAFGLAAAGFRVTAVDYTESFVDLCRQGARERKLTIEVQCADAAALPFADASFDHVMMVGQLLGHVRPREKRLTVLREIRRVMKDGPAIVSTNAVERSPLFRAYFLLVHLGRRLYNPRRLEPYDALVRRIGGRRRGGERPVFHWYKTPHFQRDAREAGLRVADYLRRHLFETDLPDPTTSGETFYVVQKENA